MFLDNYNLLTNKNKLSAETRSMIGNCKNFTRENNEA